MEAVEPIISFHRYKVIECAASCKFFLLLRSIIISAKAVGLIKVLVNEQLCLDWKDAWKQLAKESPVCLQGEVSAVF